PLFIGNQHGDGGGRDEAGHGAGEQQQEQDGGEGRHSADDGEQGGRHADGGGDDGADQDAAPDRALVAEVGDEAGHHRTQNAGDQQDAAQNGSGLADGQAQVALQDRDRPDAGGGVGHD